MTTSPAPSAADRKASLEALRHAQFVFGISQHPKGQVLDNPADVKALRERLEAVRDAASGLSPALRETLAVPWADFEAIDSGTEAVWKAAKRATPKLIAELTPLVRDDPEAAFFITPVKRGRKGAAEPEPEKISKLPKEKPKPKTSLNGNEIAALELAIQQRAIAENAFFTWLRGDHDLPPAEWRKRRAEVERARREEDRYLERLLKARARPARE